MDWPIFVTALIIGAFNSDALIIAAWLAINTALSAVVVDSIGWYWQSMTLWAVLFWGKDLVFMALCGIFRRPLIITLGFAATCLFHQVTSWQIATYTWENITLFDYRPGFMMYLSAIMLATVIKEAGDNDGGKRVRDTFIRFYGRMGGVLRFSAREAAK